MMVVLVDMARDDKDISWWREGWEAGVGRSAGYAVTLAVTLTGAKYEVIVKVSTQQLRAWGGADGNRAAGWWMDG